MDMALWFFVEVKMGPGMENPLVMFLAPAWWPWVSSLALHVCVWLCILVYVCAFVWVYMWMGDGVCVCVLMHVNVWI